MSYVGIPQAAEAIAIKLTDTAARLRALNQAIVRPDLDEAGPRAFALDSVKSSIKCLQELQGPLEPKAEKKAAKK
ncbi:MAG: hypothetical protein ABFD89_17440 [Bryobacteraceae bacterium]